MCHCVCACVCVCVCVPLHSDDSVSVPLEPLDVQLEALKLWHAALSGHLRTFKSRFRGAGCGLVITADREVGSVCALGAVGVRARVCA